MSGLPDPKSRSLARGTRRYRRKVASPKQWQAIIAAKTGPCRVYGDVRYVLTVKCLACNRPAGFPPCALCGEIEYAERSVNGTESPQLAAPVVEFHHLISRAQGGDDVADNIVPLSPSGHRRVTEREPVALAALAASLTDSEYAYVVSKLGESGPARLFGVDHGRT